MTHRIGKHHGMNLVDAMGWDGMAQIPRAMESPMFGNKIDGRTA